MKYISSDSWDRLPGRRLDENDTFCFSCHSGVSCFNRCCRNLNLFLYPYDVLRLKQNLGISSDRFIDRYVDVVLRPDHYFPEVLLRMSDDAEKTCPYLAESGCTVYTDRPDTCRNFPIERGISYDAGTGQNRLIHFFKPPDFCRGQDEDTCWTPRTWARDQDAVMYNRVTAQWAEIRRLFQTDPWGAEGPEGSRAKMAFMATYNLDRFRDFVFNSSFLNRYRLKTGLAEKIRADDDELLQVGFAWVKLYIWNMKSRLIR